MRTIVFASNNKNKIKQVKDILSDFEVLSLEEAGITIDIEESGLTFEENAKIKATEIHKLLPNNYILADDSGLEIDHLDGWPGVITHRFLGEKATYHDRNQEILRRLLGVPHNNRGCLVVCEICLIEPNGKTHSVKGEFRSKIAEEERGGYIFGFDGIVEAENGKTIAEIPEKEKIYFNARSRALKNLAPIMDNIKKEKNYEN